MNYEPHDHTQTESGLYRKIKSIMFPVVAALLWMLLTWMAGSVYADVKSLGNEVATLKAQRESDVEIRDELRTAIKGLQQDVKELLREVRR